MALSLSKLVLVVGANAAPMVSGLKIAENRVKAFATTVSSNFKTAFIGGIGGGLVQLAGASIEKLRAAIIQQFADTSRLSGGAAIRVQRAAKAAQQFGQAVFDAVQRFTVALAPSIERVFNGLAGGLQTLRPLLAAFAADVGRAFTLAVETVSAIIRFFSSFGSPKITGSVNIVSSTMAFILEVAKNLLVTVLDIGKALLDVAAVMVQAISSLKTGKMSEDALQVVRNLNQIKLGLQLTQNAARSFNPFEILENVKLDQIGVSLTDWMRGIVAEGLSQGLSIARFGRGVLGIGAGIGQSMIRGIGGAFRFLDEKAKDRLDSIRSLESGLTGALEAGSLEAVQAQIAVRDPLAGIKQKAEQELLGETQKQTSLLDNISKGVGDLAAKLGIVGISG